jgi:hypothetical protein
LIALISEFFQLSGVLFATILGLPVSAGVTLGSFVIAGFAIITLTGIFFKFRR